MKIRQKKIVGLDSFDRDLIEKVKQCRKTAVMSQEELAQFMGDSQQFISGIETGREKITVEFLKSPIRLTGQTIDLTLKFGNASGDR